jgi:predicted DNA-binding transcriptional regulator YafY
MSINERVYKIDQLLHERRSISFQDLLDKLEVSRATLKRDLAYMRDRLNAPIIYDKDLSGYRLGEQGLGAAYELPGLWFSSDEIYALMTMQHLLSNLDTGGLLGPHIKPLQSRLSVLLEAADNSVDQIQRRIKVENLGARHHDLALFQAVGSALINRKRLKVKYYARGVNAVSERELSPQRLIHYRGNWYLDAWCHLRKDLRSFAVDAIQGAEILEVKAEEIADGQLNEVLGAGYGIFSGKEVEWAILHFTPERARWVATERWHSKQSGQFLNDGTYELKIPFSDARELSMDILKHGAEVKVIEPPALVRLVRESLNKTSALYK